MDNHNQHQKQVKERESIHSGHFMVSDFDAEDEGNEICVPVPDDEDSKILSANSHILSDNNSNAQQVAIDTSLAKLFQCMSLAYRQKLTSPKWNRFRGIRLRWKDKIRLNNVIWRCWHLQFIRREGTLICQFASPLDVDIHNKPEAVVLEGKYWKRKLAAVTAEYKRWRIFYRNHFTGHGTKEEMEMVNDELMSWSGQGADNMMVDEDYMGLMSDTLFTTISSQPFVFPDSREIAKAGLAEFIQPSLGPLQPNLDDYMDTFDPLQEFLTSKLPTVPEEQTPMWQTFVDVPTIPTMMTQTDSLGVARPINQSARLLNMPVSNMPLLDENQTTHQHQQLLPQSTVQSYELESTSSNVAYGISMESCNNANLGELMKLENEIVYHKVGAASALVETEYADIASNNNTMTKCQEPGMSAIPKATRFDTSKCGNPPSRRTKAGPLQVDVAHPCCPDSSLASYRPHLSCYMQNRSNTLPCTKSSNLFTSCTQNDASFKNAAIATAAPALTNAPLSSFSCTTANACSNTSHPSYAQPDYRNFDWTCEGESKLKANKKHPNRDKPRSRSSTREPPKRPPLLSAASDPALLGNGSVLLTQLLTAKNGLLNSANVLYTTTTSNKTISQERSHQIPTQVATTLPVEGNQMRRPVSILSSSTAFILTSVKMAPNSEKMAGISSTVNSSSENIKCESNATTTIPNSPTSSSQGSMDAIIGSPPLQFCTGSTPSKDPKRSGHIHAEQKRRCNIKNGFDVLHALIPALNQNPTAKLSKAAMLQKAAEHIRHLRTERNNLKDEMDNLRTQIEALNTSISNCQSLLPATGAPISRYRESRMQEMFDEYVNQRTNSNWKFSIFSLIFRPILASFNSMVSNASLDDLYRSTLLWVEQHCTLVDLRPVVLNSLRYVCTHTEILSEPERFPEEARRLLMDMKNQNNGAM